jgi:FMN reductase
MPLVALNGSPSRDSKTGALAEAAVRLAGNGTVHHVADLSADALFMRAKDPALEDLLGSLAAARPLVLASPTYRATYTGMLKTVLDLVPAQPGKRPPLDGVPVVLIGTGGNRDHFLSLDTGLRLVVAAMGGFTVPTVVYATGEDFDDSNVPGDAILGLLQQALDEAARLA